MKKLFFVVSALAALALLAPSAGFAQHVYSNQVGMYMTSDGTGETGTMTVGNPVTVWVVLTKPTDVQNGEAPYEALLAYEVALRFTPSGGLLKTGEVFPSGAVNIGKDELATGWLEYIVAMPYDHPVVDEAVWLVGIDFLALVSTPIYVSLEPSSKPSIDGEMVFMAVSPDLRVMYPAGGSTDGTVFTFNVDGGAVAVDNESFGSVKALYR